MDLSIEEKGMDEMNAKRLLDRLEKLSESVNRFEDSKTVYCSGLDDVSNEVLSSPIVLSHSSVWIDSRQIVHDRRNHRLEEFDGRKKEYRPSKVWHVS